MAERIFRVVVPEGTRLGRSHGTGGDFRGNLYDETTGRLVGSAEMTEVDDGDTGPAAPPWWLDPSVEGDEEQLTPAGLAALLGLVVAAAAVSAAAPVVVMLWQGRVLPRVRAWWRRVRRLPGPEGRVVGRARLGSAPARGEVSSALEVYREPMSAAEARERLVAAVVARAVSEEQLRVLRERRVEDPQAAAAAEVLASVPPERLAGAVRALLDANPTLLVGLRSADAVELVVPARRRDGLGGAGTGS